MGKRKIALKKKCPNRHEAYLKLREKNTLEVFVDRNGNESMINPIKRFLLNKPYSNPELVKEVWRRIAKHGFGEEKYNKMLKGEKI